jgi:hypothetical protein
MTNGRNRQIQKQSRSQRFPVQSGMALYPRRVGDRGQTARTLKATISELRGSSNQAMAQSACRSGRDADDLDYRRSPRRERCRAEYRSSRRCLRALPDRGWDKRPAGPTPHRSVPLEHRHRRTELNSNTANGPTHWEPHCEIELGGQCVYTALPHQLTAKPSHSPCGPMAATGRFAIPAG